MATLTAAQSASISAQIKAISATIAQVSSGVQALSSAKAAGMTITPTTTVAQASSYTASAAKTTTPATTTTYKIVSGDTLSGIAAKNNTTVAALMAANPSITDPNKIYAGNTITIPKKIAEATTALEKKQAEEKLVELEKEKEGTDLSWLTSLPEYQNLSPDMQEYLKQYYAILKINDTETQKKLTAALDEAKKQANPYWAEIMTIAQDDLSRALKTKSDDFASQEAYLTEQINRIKTDLATKRGDLTIDEQAELARQARSYEVNLNNLRETAAATGLTFSTRRAEAETRLGITQQDIVESTKTKYMREARDLETLAARGEKDAIAKLAEYKRILGEQQMDILRAAESKLGTAGLPTLTGLAPGVAPIGGIGGSLEEQKIKDIWERASALSALGNPFLS